MDRSNLLREEGLEICEDFGFRDLLGRYGEAHLVGSVALDLVVKPDIDFHLLVEQYQVLDVTRSIMEKLIVNERILEVRITDYLEQDSLKIGIDSLPGRGGNWSVDIWVTSDISTTGFKDLEDFRSLLTDRNRDTILEIKRYFYEKEQLRDGLSSAIYHAVLYEGISSVSEFQSYSREHLGPEEE